MSDIAGKASGKAGRIKAGKTKPEDKSPKSKDAKAQPKAESSANATAKVVPALRSRGEDKAAVDPSAVQKRAHQLWEAEGRPHGRDEAHWHQAVREFGAAARPEPKAGGAGKKAGRAGKTK